MVKVTSVSYTHLAVANSGCMVQHCLPAHRGEEITADVFESHAYEIFDEAENRLHAKKSNDYFSMSVTITAF